ncbi:MAG: hypothetical protein D6771_07620 [Zetaproteobacteria bacterium]|nr:MAG: hypothetical protein D6771_07620 [Zetaproteobacteria bacterium]
MRTARGMHKAALEHARGADVFVAAAAVSDYRPVAPLAGKRKRVHEAELIPCLSNPDIVREVAALADGRPRFVLAFALEASDHLARAKEKLRRKRVDVVVANDLRVMGAEMAHGWWVEGEHEEEMSAAPKEEFAAMIVERIMARIR